MKKSKLYKNVNVKNDDCSSPLWSFHIYHCDWVQISFCMLLTVKKYGFWTRQGFLYINVYGSSLFFVMWLSLFQFQIAVKDCGVDSSMTLTTAATSISNRQSLSSENLCSPPFVALWVFTVSYLSVETTPSRAVNLKPSNLSLSAHGAVVVVNF